MASSSIWIRTAASGFRIPADAIPACPSRLFFSSPSGQAAGSGDAGIGQSKMAQAGPCIDDRRDFNAGQDKDERVSPLDRTLRPLCHGSPQRYHLASPKSLLAHPASRSAFDVPLHTQPEGERAVILCLAATDQRGAAQRLEQRHHGEMLIKYGDISPSQVYCIPSRLVLSRVV